MFTKLQEIKKEYQTELDKLTKKSNTCSNIRLILFLIILIILINTKFNFQDNIALAIISGTLLVVFFIIVIYHNHISKKETKYQKYISLIKDYELRRNGEWKNKFDTGENILTNDLAIDLDLVGKNSLFQLINISKSINSKRTLIKKLIELKPKEKDILNNQEAIKELKLNPKFILKYLNIINDIKNIDETDYENNLKLLNEDKHVSKKELIFGVITAAITDIILILGILNIINIRFFFIMLILQLMISYIYLFKYNEEFENISKCGRLFTDYNPIYPLITNAVFKSKKLNRIKDDIKMGDLVNHKLNKICNLDGYRYNFITNVILNAIFSLNIVVLYKYNKLIIENKEIFISNTKSITELENLISFTTIPLIKDNVTLPNIADKTSITFKDIAHPLLNEDKCITNNFQSKDDINIITGSNMSGKTSFMRTIAINLILMYNGSYVNASSFTSSINKIFTSIRVTDDIEAGISTFYGELLRIEKILTYSKKDKSPMIVFIDEIFKGTNYKDRILGAKEIIKKLSKLDCIVLITTHDFELCEIDNKKIYNYHFEEQYNEDKISFDYKIKSGMCTKTNAKYLMSLIGIIDK